MMGRWSGLVVSAALALAFSQAAPAVAADCAGNPDAIGTSRTLVVDPAEHPRIGTMQYTETLPLADREVVLTFDDGPIPGPTNAVLETLASHCAKATFFLVGRMAKSHPDMVRKLYAAGHTIATHSENHPFTFNKMPQDKFLPEIEDGISHVTAALESPDQLSPFFRIPGLLRAEAVEGYLSTRGIQVWSADFPADDWKHIPASEIIKRAISRIEAKGRGVLLLHDIKQQTVIALPILLKELKNRGYRIVHVQAATAATPKTATDSAAWRIFAQNGAWPAQAGAVGVVRTASLATMPTPYLDDRSVFSLPGGNQMTAAPIDWMKYMRRRASADRRIAAPAHGPRKKEVEAPALTENTVLLPDLNLSRFLGPQRFQATAPKRVALGILPGTYGQNRDVTGAIAMVRRGRPANAAFPKFGFP